MIGLVIIPIAIFIADTIIKQYIDSHKKLGETEKVCGGKILIRKYYNSGAAFNFLAKRPKWMKQIHTVFVAVLALTYVILIEKKGNAKLIAGLGMMLGGGFNNLVDRYTKEHVVDYFSFNVKNKKMRGIIFNISDLFVFLGAIIAVLSAM